MFESLHLPECIRLLFVKYFSEIVGPGLWFDLNKKIKKKLFILLRKFLMQML